MRTAPHHTDLPRIDLRGFTSPVHFLPRLSDELDVEVWCKRDDLGSVGLAGNKVRKLETELAHARALGATHLVTEGSRHSNATRAAAAAAASIGMKCTLVLCHDEPKEPVGNLLLDALFGADLRLVGDTSWGELARLTEDVVRELEAAGERVHRLPIGSATGRGAASFARAYIEAEEQMEAQGASFRTIVHASSAGSTHAGLVLGRALRRQSARVIGVVVAGEVYDDVSGTYLRLANEAADLIAPTVRLAASDIELTEEYLGEGYGQPAPGVTEAIDLMARLEGIVVDPVYTAKAVAAILDMARRGTIEGPVLFWHTGGYHALFDPSLTATVWDGLPRLRNIRL
ncbi:1-aminocyclopropane-1-carboxylate deaminase/D-cysteine desulfhydrase [Streptomyces scabiei]|uniref:1-aminocyclopropane-1-carboxylate deaminase/D-cysteine desulfhydrase n=1 Tax=Streptomyces scabiei TaxID=1930 RepID=UPI000765E078|nr:pyridoxal-phosphate dependent enzyme [Streptomyces scabiei]MBP5933531.1 pyridoxal-phosphate dependent enzyme [Streptomyces sp. LBUM 1479]MDX2536075.1 pyridoxal-phosphate dependent enzyme [Streptomyces scabiei]MDX2797144.1 pyridoxal-phosphate dependent enzyme [Streptomyces scabiei]MDX2860792.1 pyridoxal-phosphate dependent enzyme [Streptomyces scabiei]MDX3825839.1 pyridoxal-phosphate dependent enzyme [Streptomyces scabiei]